VLLKKKARVIEALVIKRQEHAQFNLEMQIVEQC
jgi:hypothetical protein